MQSPSSGGAKGGLVLLAERAEIIAITLYGVRFTFDARFFPPRLAGQVIVLPGREIEDETQRNE